MWCIDQLIDLMSELTNLPSPRIFILHSLILIHPLSVFVMSLHLSFDLVADSPSITAHNLACKLADVLKRSTESSLEQVMDMRAFLQCWNKLVDVPEVVEIDDLSEIVSVQEFK